MFHFSKERTEVNGENKNIDENGTVPIIENSRTVCVSVRVPPKAMSKRG